jgi:hypothetical protein
MGTETLFIKSAILEWRNESGHRTLENGARHREKLRKHDFSLWAFGRKRRKDIAASPLKRKGCAILCTAIAAPHSDSKKEARVGRDRENRAKAVGERPQWAAEA